MINNNVKAGDTIYVYECDDNDESITGYMLLAKVGAYSICSSFIDGENDLDAILNYHMLETATEYNTELFVFLTKIVILLWGKQELHTRVKVVKT